MVLRLFKGPEVFSLTSGSLNSFHSFLLKAWMFLKSKEVFNNGFKSIQRPGRVFFNNWKSQQLPLFFTEGPDVFKNAFTSFQRPGGVFTCPDNFTASTLFLKARTCLKRKKVFNNGFTSFQRPGGVFTCPDVFTASTLFY